MSKLYGIDGQEELHHVSAEDCARDYFNNDDNSVIGSMVTITEYVQRTIDDNYHNIDDIVECFDDEYGGGDDSSDISDRMREAHKDFMKVFKEEYHVWQHEPIRKLVFENLGDGKIKLVGNQS